MSWESVDAVLLTPGAGAGRDHASLVSLADALSRARPPLPVRRIDFPYRIAGRRVPDRAPVAVGHIKDETAAFAAELGTTTDRVVIGGRSYGGRMCSMAAAEGLAVAGLALISYPLHPPGQPGKLRTDHFPLLNIPVLFVSGRRDPFGSPEEFDRDIPAIPGPVQVVRFDGAHDLRGRNADVTHAVCAWIRDLG